MGPFTKHIVDAIRINFHRSIRYAKLTFGLSLLASWGLILFEVAIIPLSLFFDYWYKSSWKERGFLIMEEDFIDMVETPIFKSKTTEIPNGWPRLIPTNKWRNTIYAFLSKYNYKESYEYLDRIQKRKDFKRIQYPLTFHFIESVHRGVALTLNLESSVRDNDKRAFHKFRNSLIFSQLIGLEGALLLDFISYPVRRKGIPIYLQDVPEIPIPQIKA